MLDTKGILAGLLGKGFLERGVIYSEDLESYQALGHEQDNINNDEYNYIF